MIPSLPEDQATAQREPVIIEDTHVQGQGSDAEKGRVGERSKRERDGEAGDRKSWWNRIYSTPWLSGAALSPVNEPSFRPESRATISARISSTSLGTVLS